MEFFCENAEAEYACDRKRGAMHVIIGEYKYGKYLSIPDWGVGSPLAELDDSFWNREQLEKWIGRVDALTLSEAIKTLSKIMEDVG